MKKKVSIVFVTIIMMIMSSCGSEDTVVKEIYKGTGYMTINEANEYVSGLLGTNASRYEVDVYDDVVRYSLEEKSTDEDWLERTVRFSDGTSITIPCSYSDIKSIGWNSEEKEDETWVSNNIFYCRNNRSWKIGCGRRIAENEDYPSIQDSTIDEIDISCGDFATKEDYVLILNSHPEFEYMGISRDSTPAQVIQTMGIPTEIEHNGINMYFTYESYDYSIKENTKVTICWLTLKSGSEIMRDFEILRIAMSSYLLLG